MKKETHDLQVLAAKEEQVQKAFVKLSFCTLGAVIMAFNLKSFVATGELFPGGFAGVTLLIQRSAAKFFGVAIPYSALYIPLNLPPIFIGFKFIGRKFTMYSLYVVVLSSLLTDWIPQIPITYDVLLISVFGGIINGAAISLCLQNGASGGGTDFISIYFSEKKGINTYNYILAGNVVILTLAGIMFGWDAALYSIVYQFATTQVIQLLYKRYDKSTLLIITEMPNAIYDKIRITTHHDATMFQGTGLYMDSQKFLLYSVVSTEDVNLLVKVIKETDPKAFINVLKTDTLTGRFYKKPNE
jgi:uncharacterized membrane-anchored protein YitT (DUF2179 family)